MESKNDIPAYIDSLQNDAKMRYRAKLQLIGAETCPYQVSEEKRLDDPTKWPNISYHDLYHYLIKTPRAFSFEAMENYKSLDAYKCFIDGWVQTIKHMTCNDESVIILKADVRPSFRTSEKPHKPWVALENTGSVIIGHCDCMAGLGETCSHVAAVLYKVEAAVRIGYTTQTPTDIPCKWNQNFTKNVLGSPVAEMNLYSSKAKAKLNNSAKKTTEPPSDEDFNSFLMTLNDAAPKTVGLSLFADYQKSFNFGLPDTEVVTLIPPLRKLFNENNLLLSTDEYNILVEETMSSMKKHSSSEYVYVEETTRNQSLSLTWFEQRAGRITGSAILSVIHGDVKRPSKCLVEKLCSDRHVALNVPAIDWGTQNENKALNIYKSLSSGIAIATESVGLVNQFVHAEFEMQSIGLVISEKTPWMAASPDACVFCSCCGYDVVEVKCPYSLRVNSLKEELDFIL